LIHIKNGCGVWGGGAEGQRSGGAGELSGQGSFRGGGAEEQLIIDN